MRHNRSRALRRLLRDPLTLIGSFVLISWLVVALLAPTIAPHDPFKIDILNKFSPPSISSGHLMGTDNLGRDILSRIMYGSRISLMMGFVVVTAATLFGVVVGTVSGYFGGAVDDVIMRVAEIFMGVPTFFLLMVVVVALGPGIMNALIAMIFVWWPAYARLARGQVLVVKNLTYVESARSIGVPTWRILTHHILRNIFSPIVAQMTMDLGYVILAATSLSFLGLGAQRPSPEWGLMVSSGRDYIEYAWWVSTLPGLAIASVVLGFNLFGDALGQMLNRKG
ncbi:ABC transporter permease [Candidatus Bipolaricaulota bacterium]